MIMKKLLSLIGLLAFSQWLLAAVPVEQWLTPQGTRVQFVASRALPMLDVQIDFAAGSLFDPPGKAGLAALTHAVLDLGAGKRDETAIAEQLADVGAQLSGQADTDRANLSLRSLSAADKRGPALAILRDILHAPRFDPAILAREKERTIAQIKEAQTRPDEIASKAFWAALYPEHPYGREATPASVSRLTRQDVLAFHARHYVASNANITLVGNLTRTEAEEIAAMLAAALPAGKPAPLPAAPLAPVGREIRIAHPASQAHVFIGLPAIERGNPDFFPLLVANYSLGGGGFVSRLMKEIRDQRGYAYSVHSYFTPLRQPGPFLINLQTKRTQADEAAALARKILEDFVQQGPSDEEIAAAKANLVGSFPLRLDSNKKMLDNLAMMGFYHLPADYLDRYQDNVRAVTPEAIRSALLRYLRPEKLITVKVAAE